MATHALACGFIRPVPTTKALGKNAVAVLVFPKIAKAGLMVGVGLQGNKITKLDK